MSSDGPRLLVVDGGGAQHLLQPRAWRALGGTKRGPNASSWWSPRADARCAAVLRLRNSTTSNIRQHLQCLRGSGRAAGNRVARPA